MSTDGERAELALDVSPTEMSIPASASRKFAPIRSDPSPGVVAASRRRATHGLVVVDHVGVDDVVDRGHGRTCHRAGDVGDQDGSEDSEPTSTPNPSGLDTKQGRGDHRDHAHPAQGVDGQGSLGLSTSMAVTLSTDTPISRKLSRPRARRCSRRCRRAGSRRRPPHQSGDPDDEGGARRAARHLAHGWAGRSGRTPSGPRSPVTGTSGWS